MLTRMCQLTFEAHSEIVVIVDCSVCQSIRCVFFCIYVAISFRVEEKVCLKSTEIDHLCAFSCLFVVILVNLKILAGIWARLSRCSGI